MRSRTRVAIVDAGRIIACGPPDELVASLGAGHVIGFELAAGAVGEPPDLPGAAAGAARRRRRPPRRRAGGA